MGERKAGWEQSAVFGPDSLFAERHYLEDRVVYRYPRCRYCYSVEYPSCLLANCDLCGKLHAGRRLLQASLPRLSRSEPYDLFLVCIGCHSRVRSIWRKWTDFTETRAIINRLEKAIRDGKKSPDDGRSPRRLP